MTQEEIENTKYIDVYIYTQVLFIQLLTDTMAVAYANPLETWNWEQARYEICCNRTLK